MKPLHRFLVILIVLFPLVSNADDWRDKIKKTSLEYADKKKDELVQETSKKAIIALYKKIYPQLKNKSERDALRELGNLGMNASRLNSLASDLASGDPNKVQNAAELLAVDVGHKVADLAKLPNTRDAMKSLLGQAGTVKDVSSHLGALAGGDSKPLLEFTGDLVIKAAGGANIVGFYRNAYGVMEFAKDAFVDSQIEDFYQQYKEGKFDPMQLDLAGSHFAIRDKIIAEKKKKEEGLGNAALTPELREHLTSVNEAEFKQRLLDGFKARAEKERQAEEDKVTAAAAAKQAEEILNVLEVTARGQGKEGWADPNSGVPMKFIELVRRKAKEDPYFDADNTTDLRVLGRLLSNQLVHGEGSPEYQKALEDFNRYRSIKSGEEPMPQGIPSGTLSGRWTGTYSSSFKVSGTFRLAVDSAGNISGSFAGDDSGTLSGKVTSSGNVNVSSGGGKAGSGNWSGTITKDAQGRLSGRGSWSSGSSRGTWSGSGG